MHHIEQPRFSHRRPDGPRDPGDAWVVTDTGERYWGRFGAAGLVAHDPARGILLQHRVSWSHHGETWGIPGGAKLEGEGPEAAALREAGEEAEVPPEAVRLLFSSVLDLGFWSYTTVVCRVLEPFEPVIGDPESNALEWVAVDQVDQRPLHPGFAASWPLLRSELETRPTVVVDAANVIGSVPDGWWRDRPGAGERLAERLALWASDGVDAGVLGLPATRWFPEVVLVVEGQANTMADAEGITLVRAPGAGDDALVAEVERLVADESIVTVVTSDRELTARVAALGASTHGAGWLLTQLD